MKRTVKMSKFGKSVFYTVIGRYSNFIINLIINIVLARLLTPKDFGIFALLQIFTGLFLLISNSGLSVAIIRSKELTKKDINSLFTFSIILSFCVFVVFIIAGAFISLIMHMKIYLILSFFIGLSIFFLGSSSVPNGVVSKNLDFKYSAKVSIYMISINGLVSIPLAFYHFGVYALAFGTLLSAFSNFFLLYLHSKVHLGKLRMEPINKIKNFALNMLGVSIINYISNNMDNLLVATFFGTISLANYSKSYQLMKYPQSLIGGALNSTIVPVLNDKTDDKRYLLKFFKKLSIISSWSGFIITVFFYINSESIIFLLFGKQWEGAVEPFKYLSIAVGFQLLQVMLNPMFEVINKPNLLMKVSAITTSIMFLSMGVGIFSKSLTIFSILISCGNIINYLVSLIVFYHCGMNISIKKSLSYLKKIILLPLISSIFLGIISNYLTQLFKVLISNGIYLTFINGIFYLVLSLTVLWFFKVYKYLDIFRTDIL